MSKWQPIETAPKDGTHVLAFWGYVLDGSAWTCYAITKYIGGVWVDHEDSDQVFSEPTHWMPLPEPPQP